MKQTTFLKTAVILSVLVLAVLPVRVIAAEPAKELVGDWRMTGEANGRPMDSILSLTLDKDGKLVGKTINFFGVIELKDIKFEADKLTFTQTMRFRDNESTSNFTGTLKDGKLTGTMSSERGEYNLQGARIQPKPAIAGVWEITTKRTDRETTSTLTIKADKDGKLSGLWKSQRGEGEVSDVSFKDDKLSFKRKMQSQDQQQVESAYELTVKGDTMTGTSKSPRGEASLTGKRANPPVVGTWELTMTSERGERIQLLTIYPDLSALYGPSELEKIIVEDNKISFKMSRTFGDRTFEMEFKGTLEGDKLTGEMTTGPDNPAQKVVGKKIVPGAKPEAKPQIKAETPKEKPAAK
jgi:hypothetical protein